MVLTPNQKHAVQAVVRLKLEVVSDRERLAAVRQQVSVREKEYHDAKVNLIREFGSQTEQHVFQMDGKTYLFNPEGGPNNEVVQAIQLHEVK